MTSEAKYQALKVIRDEVLALDISPLYQYRQENNYFPVIGDGNHDAEVMFIGEAPGKNEAKTAKPFCGSAGKILDELLADIVLARTDVYITNIVKDRPPENRDPTPHEIAIYAPYLDRQIDIIKPKIIATLGRFSMLYILQKYNSPECFRTIGELHGRAVKIKASYGPVWVLPLYHPAAAIYNQNLKSTLKSDFLKLKELLERV